MIPMHVQAEHTLLLLPYPIRLELLLGEHGREQNWRSNFKRSVNQNRTMEP